MEANAYNLSLWETDAAQVQLARSRVFDLLIGNHDRQPTDILSPVRGASIYLIDHSKAFSTEGELPASAGGEISVTSSLAASLATLDRDSVAAELGDLLSDVQLEALLARRDEILRVISRAAGAVDAVSGPGGP